MRFEHWTTQEGIRYLISRETPLGKGTVEVTFPKNGGKKKVTLDYSGSYITRFYPTLNEFEMTSVKDAIHLLKKLGGLIETNE